jgi:hypothetical protein
MMAGGIDHPSHFFARQLPQTFDRCIQREGNLAMNSPHLYERITRDNAVLLLVDHQVGLYTGVRDIETLELKHNVVGLTKAALALKVPVIVTTTTEKMWGPLIPNSRKRSPT